MNKPAGKPKQSAASLKEPSSRKASALFPIVAIGASAGGLEAFEQFLANVPENSGIGYVVIQHLDPTQKGMLPELLQRITPMKVFQVKDRVAVKPNCVYVIPPNTSMSILKGVLHLFEPIESRGLRLPIDFFFRSLADDRLDRSVGVILSGMGSDGSIGIRAIKERNGVVMVQEPATARYDSMPRNAIDSVLIDIVAPASELPARLMDYLKHVPAAAADLAMAEKDQSALEKIIILLRTYTGNDFSMYKHNTLYRRIERRMGIHKIDKIASYVTLLKENPKEADILFRELLIGVTNFFRDPLVWEKLADTALPSVILKQPDGAILRAWVPGCSSGEEAYSLAIVFREVIERVKPHAGITLQIFASDLDTEAIETARKGFFPQNIAADVSPKRLSRFFYATDEGYRVNAEIREMIVFAKHNIIMHPPFTKLDILTCRNLLIYMDSALQKKMLDLFYYSLNPDGILVLGSAETPGIQSTLFSPIDAKLKIYKRSVAARANELLNFPSSFSQISHAAAEKQVQSKPVPNIQSAAEQLLLQNFAPPSVLVNENGDIINISGHTGKYLEPAVGKANLNIFAMLRDELRNEFSSAFRQAVIHKETVVLRNLSVGKNGGSQALNISIHCIDKPASLKGMFMIIFIEIPEISGAGAKKHKGTSLSAAKQQELEEKLKHAREQLQSTVEMMQTSQEEQKSTNEELTTSKEEMQSLNEELQTLNAELQSKVDEFVRVSNDMKNLLNSTDIATLFLDKDLNIRRYTYQATKIFKLIKSDIGRPITDQASELAYPNLADDALEVLRTLVFTEKQISSHDGRWFTVRIMPYRTADDRIDGLVITFVNNSGVKYLEEQLHEIQQKYRLLMNSYSDVLIQLSPELKILEFNPEAEKFFGKKRRTVVKKDFIQLFVPAPKRAKTEKDLKKLLKGAPERKLKTAVTAAGGKITETEWSVNTMMHNDPKNPAGIILIAKNPTKQ